MANGGIRRETSRDLVAGSWDAVAPQNFRSIFSSLDEAEDYVASAGLAGTPQVFGVVRVRFRTFPNLTFRRGWEGLSAQTKKDYSGSKAAQSEAAAHDMTVPEWYEVAPDLKAFRRKARGRSGAEGITPFADEFHTYIARKYKGLTEAEKAQLSAGVAAAHAARHFTIPAFG